MVAAAIGVGVASAAAGAYSASKQSKAAKSAANAQASAAKNDVQLQEKIYNQNRTDLAPWRNTGTTALQEISDLFGLGISGNAKAGPGTATAENRQSAALSRFTASPSYSFRLTEGLKALDKTAAARGRLVSGDQLKAAEGYGQDLASTEYDNYVNRLASLAGVGQTATNTTVQAGLNYGSQAGQALENAGAARASGYMGSANALSSGIQSGVGALGWVYGNWPSSTGGSIGSGGSGGGGVITGAPAAIVRH